MARVVILVAAEMGTTKLAEARQCLSQSHRFKGICVSSDSCANVCRTENFPDGECQSDGLESKCFCKEVSWCWLLTVALLVVGCV